MNTTLLITDTTRLNLIVIMDRTLKNTPDLGKIPPQSLMAEEIVLGCMLVSKNSVVIASELLTIDTFYKLENSKVFEAMTILNEKSKEIDLLTVVDQLTKMGKLQLVGGPLYISQLTNRIASDANLREHCMILKEKYTKRKQIDFASEVIKKAYDEKEDVFETTEYMVDSIHDIQNSVDIKAEISNKDLANQLMEDIKRAVKMDGITGMPTGFKEQDQTFGGWQNSDLIILAARPGMGKTAKALCDIYNAVVHYDKTVIIFSLEMSAIQLFKRLASLATQVEAKKFRTGALSKEDWKKFHDNIEAIITDRIIIVDDCNRVEEVRNRTKRERLKRDIHGVYIDYLQIMEGKGQTRENEISYISRNLKLLAKEIDRPVIALSQLSRKVDERTDKRPRLSDLRESGAIEQDADIVTFLHRPAYYKENEKFKGESILIVAKHRNGSLKDVILKYIHERTQFVDPEEVGSITEKEDDEDTPF